MTVRNVHKVTTETEVAAKTAAIDHLPTYLPTALRVYYAILSTQRLHLEPSVEVTLQY